MFVTLYCDASFCRESRVGGWAAWLRSECGRIVRSGVTPPYCVESYEAEIAAVFAGLHLAVTSWPTTTAVLVRSDCRSALDALAPGRAFRHEGAVKLASMISDLRERHSLRLIPGWVKGHRHGAAVDVHLNRQVDAKAKAVMRYERRRAQAT